MNFRVAYIYIVVTCVLFMVSCSKKVNRSFKLIHVTLQQVKIDSAFSKDTVYYLIDFIVTPQDPCYFQIPLTCDLTYSKGIKEQILSVDIRDNHNKKVNNLFSPIPQNMKNKINTNTELMLPLPELVRVIGADSCINTSIEKINSIRRELIFYTRMPKDEVHFCRLFSYPRNKHLPYTIKINTTKSEINGTVNNNPIKGLIYNHLPSDRP